MSQLKNKIDFKVFVSVKDANPNGDPLNGNRPRTSYTGVGEMSAECIKRKIGIGCRIWDKIFLFSQMIGVRMNLKV